MLSVVVAVSLMGLSVIGLYLGWCWWFADD